MAGFFEVPEGIGPQDCFTGYWRRGDMADQLVPGMETGITDEARFRPYGYLHDLELNVLVYVLIRETAIVDSWEENGRPVVSTHYQPDEAAQLFLDMVAPGGNDYYGAFVEICGPVVDDSQGLTGVVVEAVEARLPEHLQPPEPIETTGELTRFTIPGVTQTWPKVGDYLVTSSMKYPTDEGYTWNQAWNAGRLTTGAVVRIYGYPTPIRGYQGIVPIDWTILEAGVPFTEEQRDPWDVVLPEAPPIGADPDEPGADLTQPPGGFRIPETVQNLALASFVLFFLPGLLGEEARPRTPAGGPWNME